MLRFGTQRFCDVLLVTLLLFGVCGSLAAAPVLHVLHFQGRLCDNVGKPLPDGVYSVAFDLYDDPAAGTHRWGPETHNVTQVGGVFDAQLGSVAAFPPDLFAQYPELWLEITVGGCTMPHRIQLKPSPWAIHAETCETVTDYAQFDARYVNECQPMSITSEMIVDGQVTTADVQDGSLTGTDITDASLTGTDIADGTLEGMDVADGTLTGADVQDGSLTGDDLQDGSLTGDHVQDGSLTGADVLDNSLGGADIDEPSLDFSSIDLHVSSLDAAGDGTFGGDLSVGGTSTFNGVAVFSAGLTAYTIDVLNDASVGGGLDVGGNLYVIGGGTITGTLAVAGAGYFGADLYVGGDIYKSNCYFRIDHPLDPANKYLVHSCVESADKMNVYNGNVTLDGAGEAWIELPDWFEAVNGDFRYQLTCIGGFAPVYVAEEISRNAFKIAGGEPGMKVSWQVTGVRRDPYAAAHPVDVEQTKPPRDRGLYIHPELYGEPDAKSIVRARWEGR